MVEGSFVDGAVDEAGEGLDLWVEGEAYCLLNRLAMAVLLVRVLGPVGYGKVMGWLGGWTVFFPERRLSSCQKAGPDVEVADSTCSTQTFLAASLQIVSISRLSRVTSGSRGSRRRSSSLSSTSLAASRGKPGTKCFR